MTGFDWVGAGLRGFGWLKMTGFLANRIGVDIFVQPNLKVKVGRWVILVSAPVSFFGFGTFWGLFWGFGALGTRARQILFQTEGTIHFQILDIWGD